MPEIRYTHMEMTRCNHGRGYQIAQGQVMEEGEAWYGTLEGPQDKVS